MTAEIDARYWLEVRDKHALLIAIMRFLAGDDTRISFEGNLSESGLNSLPGASNLETDVLKRATVQPELDFLTLPLRASDLRAIFNHVVAAGPQIIHIQIESHDILRFAAYDNFHPQCIVVGPGVPESAIRELLSKGVLKSFAPARPQGEETSK